MAVKERQPKGTIIHLDQGSQYSSDDWWRFCLGTNLKPSKSQRENCWDSAVAEPFFGSLNKDRIKKRIYRNQDLATANVSDSIESLYNRSRRHQHLGGISPQQLEATVPRCRVVCPQNPGNFTMAGFASLDLMVERLT